MPAVLPARRLGDGADGEHDLAAGLAALDQPVCAGGVGEAERRGDRHGEPGAGAALMVSFIAYERQTTDALLPMRFFADRGFSVTNVISISMYFGMFGSIFFLSQFMQNVLHNSPFHAGLKLLVWTGASMVVSPLAGYFSEKFGSRQFMVAGLSLQAAGLAWLNLLSSTTTSFPSMIAPMAMAGAGMALVFAPSANAVLAAVRTEETGQASGATNMLRELGGVLGIAILSTVFTSNGGYTSPTAFIAGLHPALWVGVAVLAGGALVAALVPFSARETEAAQLAAVPA